MNLDEGRDTQGYIWGRGIKDRKGKWDIGM